MTVHEDLFITDFCRSLQFDQSVVVPPGDDCAALDLGGEELILVAVDQLAAGCHYYGVDTSNPTPPDLAGRKLLARNLSDIAAMGGTPRYALVAVAVSEQVTQERLHRFADGVRQLAEQVGVQIVGGDLGRASAEVASLTIIGTVARDQICLRKNAMAGQRILITGTIGDSLDSGRHLSFTPRLEEGRWLAAGDWTRCMIDLSDGLLKDLYRVCQASGVSANIAPPQIPVNRAWQQAIHDGEDYELLFTVDEHKFAELLSRWPFETPLTGIGSISTGVPNVRDDEGTLLTPGGFCHFGRS